MHKSSRILGVIPARGGSKGIPRKNIKEIAGKPLIAWTIEAAAQSKYLDHIIVSTDDEEISAISKRYGAEVPFLRPKEISQDQSSSIDAILHVLDKISNYEYIMLLQPTSPLRTVEDIDNMIDWMKKNNYNSAVSVVLNEKSLSWTFKLADDNNLEKILNMEIDNRRQDSEHLYSLNGSIYCISTEKLKKEKTFFSLETKGFVMNKDKSFDIDDMIDFNICENILLNRIEEDK